MLAKSKKHILTKEEIEIDRSKLIFQEWCGYLIKMGHRILVKDIYQKQGVDVRTAIFKASLWSHQAVHDWKWWQYFSCWCLKYSQQVLIDLIRRI